MNTLNAANAVDAFEQASRYVVDRLLNRPGFHFLDDSKFLNLVTAAAEEDGHCKALAEAGQLLNVRVNQLALSIYGTALYEGCLHSSNAADQVRAFTELSKYMYTAAFNLLRTDTNKDALADECTQEGMVSVYLSLNKVQSPAAFLAYAVTVVTRECFAAIRRVRRERERAVSLSSDDPSGSSSDETGESSVSQTGASMGTTVKPMISTGYPLDPALFECLQSAMDRFESHGQRAVLLLHYLADLRDEEIADALSLSKGAVSTRLSRAHAQLRQDERFLDCLDDWNVLQNLLHGVEAISSAGSLQ